MAGKEIKSTLEIAMEKVAKMPELTREEIAERKEKEFALRGKAIANRYFDGSLQLTDLEIEICRFQDEEREIVRRTLESSLCDAIDLEDMDRSRRALEALQVLEKDTSLEDRARELEGIYAEYLRQRDQALAEFERLKKERLRQLGISGSAVRPNLDADRDSQQKLQETKQAFSSRIEGFKTEILQPADHLGRGA